METKHTPPGCVGENWQPIVGDDDGILLGFKHPSNLIVFRAAYHEETATAYIDLCESGDGYDEDGLIPFLCSIPSIVTQRDELLGAGIALMGWLNNADTIRRFENNNDFRIAVQGMRAAIARATGGQS